MEKSCGNCEPKACPGPLLILVNNPKQLISKKLIFERELSISLKKLTLFFLSNPVPFNGQDYEKQKGPGTSDQSLLRLQNKFTKIPLLSGQV